MERKFPDIQNPKTLIGVKVEHAGGTSTIIGFTKDEPTDQDMILIRHDSEEEDIEMEAMSWGDFKHGLSSGCHRLLTLSRKPQSDKE